MVRSDLFLKLEVVKKIISITALISTMFISVEAMALALPVTSIPAQIINSWPNRKLLDYSYKNQLLDMLPQIGLSVVMGGIVFTVQFLRLPDIATLLIQIPLGAFIYIAGSKLLHIDSYDYVKGLIRSYIKR